MKIAYVVPGPMSKGPMGRAEMQRRERHNDEHMGLRWHGDFVIDRAHRPRLHRIGLRGDAGHPPHARPDHGLRGQGLRRRHHQLLAIRAWKRHELVSMPVVGPSETAMLLAAGLGHKFSVLTIFDSLIAGQEMLAVHAGVRAKLASVRPTNIPVLELMKDPAATKRRLIEVARACVGQDRADALLFGCMTMSFLDMGDEIGAEVGVPVVNAGRAAVKHAELLVSMGLAHSKKAWPTPAKMKAGKTASDMRVA